MMNKTLLIPALALTLAATAAQAQTTVKDAWIRGTVARAGHAAQASSLRWRPGAAVHTFSTKYFERLAHDPRPGSSSPAHAGIWHLLGEVEVVFGFWAMVLVVVMSPCWGRSRRHRLRRLAQLHRADVRVRDHGGRRQPRRAAHGRRRAVQALAAGCRCRGHWASTSCWRCRLVPLLGSFITEPAAMTLAALMLRERIFASAGVSVRAEVRDAGRAVRQHLDRRHAHALCRAAGADGGRQVELGPGLHADPLRLEGGLAVCVNAVGGDAVFGANWPRCRRPATSRVPRCPRRWCCSCTCCSWPASWPSRTTRRCSWACCCSSWASPAPTPQHQDRLILREGLLVAFFLAGLVVLGGQQQWWLEPLLREWTPTRVYFGATR
jgi:hypothetical protein